MGPLPIEAVFLLGVAGAAAPEILRLYELRTKPNEFKWSWSYMLLTVPFLLLGGLVALALPATTFWGAFYAGLSMPVTLSIVAKKVMDLPGLSQPAGAITTTATDEVGSVIRGYPQAKNPEPLTGFRAYIHGLL